ncbi:2OG-Fe(II) oxygenase [Belnapia sp. T6]|uniref:2OG-Fe(II) oxygenase n=1 Tax=Belnapia mucosa TaxID=2804532 RepID=A0ABS1V7F3_9PROT|nr:2OG-Fe(II) oxygenase [Belnapia mucosa]MBL6457599.1 2OG-Fe(II) oxygenase [Belnapia mucosa]
MLKLFRRGMPAPQGASGEDVPIFDPEGLARFESYGGYRSAQPFPHLVIDGLFNPEILRRVLTEWPGPEQEVEHHNDGEVVRDKIGTTWKTRFGPQTRRLFAELNGPAFLQKLQSVTDMWGLIGDPYMFGGGLHATRTGGTLAVHADYNKHPFFKLDRRLNLLVYLNEDWTEANAGWLELWDQDMRACAERVLPVFNRTVLFSTTSTSFHGQPEPIQGPPDLWRRSIALYYFSNGRADEGSPPDASDEHSTLWKKRPHGDY